MCIGSAFGTRENRRITYKEKVNLRPGNNKISLLSVAMGLPVSFFSISHVNSTLKLHLINSVFFFTWRISEDIMKLGKLVSWVQWHCMVLTRGSKICHGLNGPTRCGYFFFIAKRFLFGPKTSRGLYIFLFSFLTGWLEGWGYGCHLYKQYVISRMVAGFSYCPETTATNMAQGWLSSILQHNKLP